MRSYSMRATVVPFAACILLSGSLSVADVQVFTDATWRAIGSTPAAGWNTSVGFDDSDSAGWELAFKSPSENNIWIDSNMSSQAPDQAWFRKVFTLDAAAIQANAEFFFDDNGEGYINGHLVITDSGGGATHTLLSIDPSFFVIGENLIALHGIDTVNPFNNVALSLTVITPEPGCAGIVLLAALFARRASRKVKVCSN